MPEYKIIIRNGPPGYADTDEDSIQIDNEEDLAAAVKKACSYYSHVRRVMVFRNDGDTMTPVNARALHVLNGNVEKITFLHNEFTVMNLQFVMKIYSLVKMTSV